MNRLVLVLCVVVIASYAALASYLVWPTLVYEHGGSRGEVNTSTSVASRDAMRNDRSSPTEQTNPVLPSYEARNQPVSLTAKSAPVVLPEDDELTWVTVLLPARVHAGSVDTPITQFYAVGTPLHARRYWNDWVEVVEPGTSKWGWIYRKYLGATSDYEQGKIASQETQEQRPAAQRLSVKRYAKAFPVKRYANSVRSKQSSRVKQVAVRPIRGRTEMASLLQRAFSGY